ncbi:MAG: cytochrome c oxidase subunit II [Bacteroidota bacterium]
MFEGLIVFGVLLIIGILISMFRINTLLNVVKGRDKKIATGSNKVNAALFVLFFLGGFGLFFWYSFAYYDDYTLPVASEHGVVTDRLFWITTIPTGFIFVFTSALLFIFPYKYQYKEGAKAHFFPHNNKLEVIWTVVPAIVLSVLVFMGLRTWNDITSDAPDDAEVIEIMGYQFAWAVRYPGADPGDKLGSYDYQLIDASNNFGIDLTDENAYDDFSPLELHVPKGKTVLFKIRARDVLHSVFAPHFRLKMDAVPGMPTHFKFVPTKTTDEMRAELDDPEFNYEIACTEVCGRGHFSMRLLVVVDEPEDYEAWKKEQITWLKLNEDYLDKVPKELREKAIIDSGIEIGEPDVADSDTEEVIKVDETEDIASL